ncbi:MAG: cytochrome-c peroxidase, partial [Chitinophagaceae bacterium]
MKLLSHKTSLLTGLFPQKWPWVYAFLLAGLVSCIYNTEANTNAEVEKLLPELGRSLFFDNRLSFNQTKSCASCHDPKFAFTDGYRRSITATGDKAL